MHGTWGQKWDNTNYLLQELRNTHENQAELSPHTFKALLERLFTSYRELADWLWEDDTALTKEDVLDYVYSDPALKICDALAQTCKHRKRNAKSKHDPITAWLSKVSSRGADARVNWENEDQTIKGEGNALELAEQVADAWWRFFESAGLVHLSSTSGD